MRIRLTVTLDVTRAASVAPQAPEQAPQQQFEHRDNDTLVERSEPFSVGFSPNFEEDKR